MVTLMRKIELQLQGGLGNQLFQLAFANNLRANSYEVKINFIRCHLNRTFVEEISQFAKYLGFHIINHNHTILKINSKPIFRYFYYKYLNIQSIEIQSVTELSASNKNLIHGYFQNVEFAEIIKQDLKQFIEIWSIQNSVAIHVRRGDYLNNSNSHYGNLTGTYYLRAIKEIFESHPVDLITFFTDNESFLKNERWIKELENYRISFYEGSDVWNSFISMARSQHIITANSTYSWWAGFLKDEGIVIQPSEWKFNEKTDSNMKIPLSIILNTELTVTKNLS